MREEVADGDARRIAPWRQRVEPRQVIAHLILEADLALCDHRQRGGCNEGLGDRGEPEDRVGVYGNARLPIRVPCRPRIDLLAMLADEDHRTDDGLAGNGVVDDAVDTGGEGHLILRHGLELGWGDRLVLKTAALARLDQAHKALFKR